VHANGHVLDLNVAWFAVASIGSKEWLFPITHKVADQENNPVLLANAYYRRSDAYLSVVVLVATLGSDWFPALPLGPIGGAYYLQSTYFLCFIFRSCFSFSFS
jgi:divalent metal cation (Fe/Co/Zn/Cd) transporter